MKTSCSNSFLTQSRLEDVSFNIIKVNNDKKIATNWHSISIKKRTLLNQDFGLIKKLEYHFFSYANSFTICDCNKQNLLCFWQGCKTNFRSIYIISRSN